MTPKRRISVADKDAFIAVYDTQADALFRFALFGVGDRELAKDLVSETFAKVWEYMTKGNKAENIKALCYRTLRNLIVDHYRKHKSSSLDGLLEAGFDPLGEEGMKHVEHEEDRAALRKAIATLPGAIREVVVLRYIEEYSPKEIAELLHISPSLVSVRLFRATALLKKTLHA